MDINIVNTILRLCNEQQTCLFEVSFLIDYCLEKGLCTNSKYVLASIKNYMEIFKISRDQHRIELFMPFEICRESICQNGSELCSNFHVCYDYFYTNVCRRSMNCVYPHVLTEKLHGNILGSLINLDLDALTKAFRVYCQTKKHLINHNPSKQPIPNLPMINTPTPSSSMINNCRMTTTPQLNGNLSWRINNRPISTPKILPKQQIKGIQICWKPQKDIQTHFIEVVFSNQGKSNGGPIRTHQVYQHLGIAQVFYENSDIADRVVIHGPVIFQSFTFTPRLLQRTVDMRHVCFSNMPMDTNLIEWYINIVSMPYRKIHFEYYQNDKQIILVEYNEDIDFAKISSNVRNHPECNGLMINCIQLYQPETLLIEYDQELTENEILKLFDKENIFHMKIYPYCSFVHFYSHEDLAQSIQKSFDDCFRITPIYIDIYSQTHLNHYLQQREMEFQAKPTITLPSSEVNEIINNESVSPMQNIDSSSIPVLLPPPIDQQTGLSELLEVSTEPKSSIKEELPSPQTPPNEEDQDDDQAVISDDDFNDLPSEFNDDDVFLDESIDNNGDMEFLRSAAKNLMSSLAEMEAASSNMDRMNSPDSLLYGDDYVITIRSRRFALAFLDYTQFRVEKQRNPDKFRLLASLKKLSNNKKRLDNNSSQPEQASSSTNETKSTKKKGKKRNKKKKNTTNQDDNENQLETE